MFGTKKISFLNVPTKYKQVFKKQKFEQNNYFILILAVFLFFEQIYYGFFIREQGSFHQKIHFFTAIIMIIFAISSVYFYKIKPIKISIFHQIYESSLAFCGIMIAVIRVLLIHHDFFRLPTIFIAVLYGMAVIFCFNPIQSFLIYFLANSMLIVFLPTYQSTVVASSYIADTISNTLIAWITSIINYKKNVKDFVNKMIIQQRNEELKIKTEQIRKMNNKLRDLTIKDELTKIYNRRKLNKVLKNEYSQAKKNNKIFSVILLDIDQFKLINDTFGHNVGDKVLKEMAIILIKNIRNKATVGRWGGEEFLIICPGIDDSKAYELAVKLRKTIEKHDFPIVNSITCSFGIASYRNGYTIEDILIKADKFLYKAKEKGRNRVENAG